MTKPNAKWIIEDFVRAYERGEHSGSGSVDFEELNEVYVEALRFLGGLRVSQIRKNLKKEYAE